MSKPKVIILDDDISVCETIKVALSIMYEVEYFTEAPDFAKYLKGNNPISLLILDYRLNDVNGIEFYKKEVLKKGYKFPTILISGFVGQNNKTPEELADLNKIFIKILEKPFEIFELLTLIQTALN